MLQPQLIALLSSLIVRTIINYDCACFSDRDILRDEFIFYSKRLMRLLIEFALSMLPFKVRCQKFD